MSAPAGRRVPASPATQLKIAVGVAAVVILVGAGAFFGWRYTTGLSRGLADLRADQHLAVRLAQVQSSIWQLRYGLPQSLVLAAEDRQRIVPEEKRLYEDIEQGMRAYAALRLSPEERQALADWNAQFTKYVWSRARWFQLQSEGKTREAAEWPQSQAACECSRDLLRLLLERLFWKLARGGVRPERAAREQYIADACAERDEAGTSASSVCDARNLEALRLPEPWSSWQRFRAAPPCRRPAAHNRVACGPAVRVGNICSHGSLTTPWYWRSQKAEHVADVFDRHAGGLYQRAPLAYVLAYKAAGSSSGCCSSSCSPTSSIRWSASTPGGCCSGARG